MPLPSERTTTALLAGLHASSDDAWRELDDRYRPVLVGLARHLGLTDADAHDAAQETLARVLDSCRDGRFDHERGRLRTWIIGIARNCIREVRRREPHASLGTGGGDHLPTPHELEGVWEIECRRAILRRSLERLRSETALDERTIDAFEQVVIRERAPADVAGELGVTRNDVYLAKHRCLAKLRTIVATMTISYATDTIGGSA